MSSTPPKYSFRGDRSRLDRLVRINGRGLPVWGALACLGFYAAWQVGSLSAVPLWLRILVAGVAVLAALRATVVVVFRCWHIRWLRRLARTEFHVSSHGITRILPRRTHVPWYAVREVTVNDLPDGFHLHIRTAWRHVRFHVQLEYLDVPKHEVVRMIRHLSGGRYPNRYSVQSQREFPAARDAGEAVEH